MSSSSTPDSLRDDAARLALDEVEEAEELARQRQPAEAALGWAAMVAFEAVRHRDVLTRAAAALAVSTFYLGALVLAHFVIDVADWRIAF